MYKISACQEWHSGLQIENYFSNMCFLVPKEPSQWDGSFEHPKHMFQSIGKKIVTILCSKSFLIWPYGHFTVYFVYLTSNLHCILCLMSEGDFKIKNLRNIVKITLVSANYERNCVILNFWTKLCCIPESNDKISLQYLNTFLTGCVFFHVYVCWLFSK